MATSDDAAAGNRVIHRDVVCPFCAGACDDLHVTVDAKGIVEVAGGCRLGRQYLPSAADVQAPLVLVEGESATLGSAIERAAELFTNARAPLILGLEHLTCEAQSLAVAIADRLGATIDSPASTLTDTRGTSLQHVGEAGCTLGELGDRADFVLLWDIFTCHIPCQLSDRLIGALANGFLGRGRADQTVVIIEETRRRSASEDLAEEAAIKQRASELLAIREQSSYEALWVVRALLKGLPLEASLVLEQTGLSLEKWHRLAEQMKSCRYGVIVLSTYDPQVARAVNELVIELNDRTRFAYLDINKSGMNSVGAEHVLTWRTGYPCAVNFGAGYPRFGPAEYSASDALELNEVDAALLFGYPNDVSWDAAHSLASRMPVVVIASAADEALQKAAVFIRTAQPGVATAGTIFRFDGVPLPLRALVSSPLPSAEQVLKAILHELA